MPSSKKMKKIVLIGEGVAGLTAFRALAVHRKSADLEISLFGSGANINLPLLPDLVAAHVSASAISYNPEAEIARKGGRYIKSKVVSVDTVAHTLQSEDGNSHSYDKLMICAGALPAFTLPGAFHLNTTGAANAIRERVLALIAKDKEFTVLVVGGGYTGIELITAVKSLCKRSSYTKVRLVLLEAADEILPSIKERFKTKIERNLRRNGIEIISGKRLNEKAGKFFIGDEQIKPDLLCLSSGVKGGAWNFLSEFNHERTKRLQVSNTLQLTKDVYALGDAAHFVSGDMPLRPSVNYAIFQARCAARNIVRELKGKVPRAFKPYDLGYVVPDFATKVAYGRAFGFFPIGGFLAFLLHYVMCIYRSASIANGWAVLKELLFGPAKERR